MPPMSGWGMGIDRFVSLLTGQDTLREVVLFPLMRPTDAAAAEAPPPPASTESPSGLRPAGPEPSAAPGAPGAVDGGPGGDNVR